MRGAGPLACKICEPHFRDACAAHRAIKDWKVSFNKNVAGAAFAIETSEKNNQSPGQRFVACRGTTERHQRRG